MLFVDAEEDTGDACILVLPLGVCKGKGNISVLMLPLALVLAILVPNSEFKALKLALLAAKKAS